VNTPTNLSQRPEPPHPPSTGILIRLQGFFALSTPNPGHAGAARG
jgi:hypothetical protein